MNEKSVSKMTDFFVFVETRLIASVPDCAPRLYRMIDFVRFVGANDYSPLRFSGWLASALLSVSRFMSRFARNQTN